jgi:hypothetical protein
MRFKLDLNSYLKEFFQDENVVSTLEKLSSDGKWQKLVKKAKKVNVENVDCNLLSVEIFDRLAEKNIVRENGSIRKCLDEYYEDILISDELRKVFISIQLLFDEKKHRNYFSLSKSSYSWKNQTIMTFIVIKRGTNFCFGN